MANVEGVIVEPHVGFNGDTTGRYGSVYRDVAPVVVVGVNWFLIQKTSAKIRVSGR